MYDTDDGRYQGWTNWHTWNANLWIGNDEETYRAAVKAAEVHNAELEAGRNPQEAWAMLQDALRLILRDCMPCGDMRRDGKAWDGIDFDCVDWSEIAAGYVEDAAAV